MEETKRKSKVLKVFLVAGFVLLLLTAAIIFLMKVSGFSFSDILPSSNEGSENQLTAEIESLKETVKKQKKTIKDLNDQNKEKSDKINQLENDLEQQKAEEKNQATDAKKQKKQQRANMIQQTYKNMDPEKAAAIFAEMKNPRAALYINMLDDKTKAAVLENLPAKKAASITPLLKAQQKPVQNNKGANGGNLDNSESSAPNEGE
ncbi:flagellar motility protein MotE (MotC chaperone) [Scopulibacillus daqui]|uniref:Flagellar motility protein MotE (MotC chaperone) n=1 Tax=Scopulibacillus daqui TaxID=1469162 RepID=A0ABS2PXZ5_9BACL|nr:hypothetical protein [Scopulibacillus daqui]MBM7644359.1 flagellar motility protein MotE (MotC chaperone) [Scopulibacillus daqui]